MQAKLVLSLLGASVLAALQVAHAQQPRKVPRVGVISGTGNANETDSSAKSFRQGLQDLGYSDGKNIRFEYRNTEGSRDHISEIVTDLINLKVDVIFSTQAIVIRAAKQATKTIPIVMAVTTDPVAGRLVDSLARPGGNITGLTRLTRELSGKRLELLTEMIPRLSRVGVLSIVGIAPSKDYEDAARILKVQLQLIEVQGPPPDLAQAFKAAVKGRASAIITTSTPGLAGYQKQIADLAVQNQLPLMSESIAGVDAGGLVTYDASREEVFKRAAVFVDKILKGAKPADLPVEQPTKFDFVINLKTAKQIGVTVPPEILARANRIIR